MAGGEENGVAGGGSYGFFLSSEFLFWRYEQHEEEYKWRRWRKEEKKSDCDNVLLLTIDLQNSMVYVLTNRLNG